MAEAVVEGWETWKALERLYVADRCNVRIQVFGRWRDVPAHNKLDLPTDNTLYIGAMNNWRVRELVLQPDKSTARR